MWAAPRTRLRWCEAATFFLTRPLAAGERGLTPRRRVLRRLEHHRERDVGTAHRDQIDNLLFAHECFRTCERLVADDMLGRQLHAEVIDERFVRLHTRRPATFL